MWCFDKACAISPHACLLKIAQKATKAAAEEIRGNNYKSILIGRERRAAGSITICK
jgi:hypothetical protein